MRLKIFTANYERLLTHNAIQDVPFTLKINQFTDLTENEFLNQSTGAKVPRKRSNKMKNFNIEKN